MRVGVYCDHGGHGEPSAYELHTPFSAYTEDFMDSKDETIYIRDGYGSDKLDIDVLIPEKEREEESFDLSHRFFAKENWNGDEFKVYSFFNLLNNGENPFVEV